MTSNPGLVCPLCPRERTSALQLSLREYLKHIQLFHSHQPGFRITCGISGCARTFQNFLTFRCHISAFHRDDPEPTNQTDGQGTDNGSHEDHDSDPEDPDGELSEGSSEKADLTNPMPVLQTSSALFLMKIKEELKLTQTAIQGIVEGVTGITQTRLSILQTEVNNVLEASGVSASSISGLDDLFDQDGVFGRPFLGMETQHQQHKYYTTHFQFVVGAGREGRTYTMYVHVPVATYLLWYWSLGYPMPVGPGSLDG